MSFCLAPAPGSVEYFTSSRLTGLGPELQSICPVAVGFPGNYRLTLRFLTCVLINLDFSNIIRVTGRVIRPILVMLGFIWVFLLGILNGLFLAVSAVVSTVISTAVLAVVSVVSIAVSTVASVASTAVSIVVSTILTVVSTVLGILLSPILIPWRMTVWFWNLLLDFYHENEPIILYFAMAPVIGTVVGIFVGKLTLYIIDVLHAWFPILRPPPPQRNRRRRKPRDRQAPSKRPATDTAAVESASSQPSRNLGIGSISAGGKDRHSDTAILYTSSTSSPSPTDDSDSNAGWGRPLSSRRGAYAAQPWSTAPLSTMTSSSLAKSSRRRTAPARVRVADTIHEESTD